MIKIILLIDCTSYAFFGIKDVIWSTEKSRGFSDFANVTRTFRKYKGCTPLEYRKKLK